jgi:uncharacterized membrane protein
MAAMLSNLRNTMIVSFIVAIVIIAGYYMHHGGADAIFWQAVFRWLHVIFGVMWIGLLWYFNFVQTRKMPEIPAELKPAVSKYIAPEALFWFRWSAAFTVLMGLLLAWNRGYIVSALLLGNGFKVPQFAFIGLGMWLGLIMAFNVWVMIWPAQKISLGLVEADADRKAKAATQGLVYSRINTFLSVPMLVCMTFNQTIFG